MNNPEWFWSHRRNASLHHMSFFMRGLAGKAWMPVVDFWFDHQIVVGVPGKGSYIFYDRTQLSSGAKYKDIQDSIDANPSFVRDFRRRTDELFGAIFFKCINIDSENLALLSDADLRALYQDFKATTMVGPIITVQLWGIEACFDERYKIIAFLRTRLKELGKERDFEMYKGNLAINIGETVALTEQKNFYQVAAKLYDNEQVRALFETRDIDSISEGLKQCSFENTIFEKHTRKYEWVNTEYTSGGWPREKWLDLFVKAITDTETPQQKLDSLLANFTELVAVREKTIQELNPPAEVLHALAGLAELISQRDWTKGYFTRALLSYHRLLDEIASRLGVTRDDLFHHTYFELEEALIAMKALPAEEIKKRREQGFAFVIKGDTFELATGTEDTKRVIDREGISEPFEKLANVDEFKGLPASLGTITGKARVLESAADIPKLQKGEILVTYMTTMEFTPAFRTAGAVITDEGGMSCHAAIVSREFKIPCIVGTKIATRVLQTGDTIEVDARQGTVKILDRVMA